MQGHPPRRRGASHLCIQAPSQAEARLMARIAGVTIPDAKRVEVSLTYIYGIGDTSSRKILATTNIDPNTRTKDLTEAEITKLRDLIDKTYRVEGDLQREVAGNFKLTKAVN